MKIIADASIPFVAECFSSVGEVELVGGREIRPDVVTDADILLVRSVTRVDSSLLADTGVHFVGTATIGFDHIDIDFLRQKNVGFASAPGSNANSAAEYVIAALLEIGRRKKIELEGKSIGVIGVGNVGSRVAKKCKALGMKVCLNDPPLQRQSGDTKYLPIEELFDCDFMTFHTPLTFDGIDKTFHLADEGFFKSLKTECVFVNTSRGGVVDCKALKAAREAGKLRALVLDVWEDEPNIDTELLEVVDIGTPHIAGYSLDGKIAGMIMIYKAACEYFGLDAKFEVKDFLPKPAVGELKIDPNSGTEQEVMAGTVAKLYSVSEDDHKLRGILNRPAEERGEFFDSLRKNYPVRREFQNTEIILETPCQAVAEKLIGIGFEKLKSEE